MRFRSARLSALAAVLAAAACAHAPPGGPSPQGPEAVALRYARALEGGALREAHALSTGAPWEQFERAYGADAPARTARAAAVLQAAQGQVAPGAAVALRATANGWRVDESALAPAAGPGPREVTRAFLDAADRGDFEAVWALLAPRWRARYTPARLAADFQQEPQAVDRLRRVRAAVDGAWTQGQGGASLALGDGQTFRLEREGDALKVGALE